MKYLYTTKPDEHCHEVEPRIWGRPVHTHEQPKLRKAGWTYNVNELKEADHGLRKEEGREEAEEVTEKMDFDEYLRRKYEEVTGKKPHHKFKRETMQKKIAEANGDDNDSV